MTDRPRVFWNNLTFWSLVALATGLALGLFGHATNAAWIERLSRIVAPLGQLWLNALQLVVLPLVVALMLAAVAGRDHGGAALGRLGLRTIGLILAFLVIGGAFTVIVAPPVLKLYTVSPEVAENTIASVAIPEAAARAADGAQSSEGGGDWISGLVPSNLMEAAQEGDILGILLFAVAFGLAVNRLPDAQRKPLAQLFTALADAMMVIIRWILVGTPIGVFALILEMSLGAGMGAAGVLVAWVVFVSGLMVLFTGLLYPLTAALGRTSIRAFARAAAPGQAVALGTRSSLAALPALIQGGRDHLHFPAPVTGFVQPLLASIFKQNRTISSLAKLLFLAHVFSVSLTIGDVVAFFLVVLLLSFSAVGVPSGGAAFTTLPAYLAAGLPIQGIIILEAVETIPDLFKTVLNVTGDLSVATVAAAGLTLPEEAPPPDPSVDPPDHSEAVLEGVSGGAEPASGG